MSYHGSGIEEGVYDTLRAYMFGDKNPYEGWTEKELEDCQAFVDWAINNCDWQSDLPDYTEGEIREMAKAVFYHELEDWREEDA